MNHLVKGTDGSRYVEASGGHIIYSEQEALDLAAFCWEQETQCLLINHENLTDDFFNLRSGLAGAILQKFSNYRIRAAAVIDPVKVSGRFRELVSELNRGRDFRVFEKKEEAERWLLMK